MERYIFVSRRERPAHGAVRCMLCGERLFPGEVYYDLEGARLCVPCAHVQLQRMLRPYRRQVAFPEVAE